MRFRISARNLFCLALATLMPLCSVARVNAESANVDGANACGFDVSFKSIPLSATEIVNPLRGLYTDYDMNIAPLPRPPFLSYNEFYWSNIEIAPHVYDFSKIEKEIAKVVAVNGKYAFRVESCSPNSQPNINPSSDGQWPSATSNVAVPADLVAQLKKGYFITESSATASWKVYVPDYNDPIYIARVKELNAALARKYDGDRRVAFIETGLIGSWGEGNYSMMPNPTPSGALPPTFDTIAQIVDDFCAKFKHTQLVSPTGIFQFQPTQPSESAYAALYHNALEYVLRNHPRIGMFRDSLGDPINTKAAPANQDWFAAPFNDPYVVAAGGLERWKYAPFNSEWFGATSQMPLALTDVPKYHVGMITNGALGGTTLPPIAMQQLETCGKLSGYRFQLDRVTRQDTRCGRSLNLTSYWENVGVTPVYEPWVAVYLFRDRVNHRVIWQGTSHLDLRRLLPTNGAPQMVEDSFQIPLWVRPGSYELSLVVEDPTRYYPIPLALATQGAERDGSYKIARIVIGE